MTIFKFISEHEEIDVEILWGGPESFHKDHGRVEARQFLFTYGLVQQSGEILKFPAQAFHEIGFVLEPVLIQIQSQSKDQDSLHLLANLVLSLSYFDHLIW